MKNKTIYFSNFKNPNKKIKINIESSNLKIIENVNKGPIGRTIKLTKKDIKNNNNKDKL